MMKTTLKTLGIMLAMAPLAALADSGFYIGGSAGGATIEADAGDIEIPGLPSGIDEDDTAWKIYGGYKFDLPVVNLVVEAGYVDFGEPEIDTAFGELLVSTTGLNVWGIAALPVGPLEVYGKLGLIAWDVEADLLADSASEDGTDIGYGLGAAFGFGRLQVRGEYELYDIDEADIGMLSLGLVYQFN